MLCLEFLDSKLSIWYWLLVNTYEALPSEITKAKAMAAGKRGYRDSVPRGGYAQNLYPWQSETPQLVLARLSGLPHTNAYRGADVGIRLDVKSVPRSDRNLLVPPDHLHEGFAYVLAEWWSEEEDCLCVQFVGYAEEFQVRRAPLRNFGQVNRPPAHLVYRNLLTSCPETPMEWEELDASQGLEKLEKSALSW